MAKHPMEDALAKAEAYLKVRQRQQRLEKAAPELLAALKAMVAEFEKFSRFGSPIAMTANEAMRTARAAIAQAEGKDAT
jgi:hypothetical protein